MQGKWSGVKRMWLAASVGLVVSGCGGGEPRPEESSPSGEQQVARSALEVAVGPDFRVTSVTAPHAVLSQAGFTASLTACNEGTAPGHSLVNLVLSSDASFSGDDTGIAGLDTGFLEPGACITAELPVGAWVPDGTYHLLAVADAFDSVDETSEQNNVHDAGLLGVGFQPDFTVSAPTAPASVLPGGAFNSSVTVCNQGTAGESTDVELFFVQDPNEEPSGPSLGAFSAGYLEAGQCVTQEVPVSVGSLQGTGYLRAFTDRTGSRPEFVESNNSALSAPIGIGYGADLVVSDVTAPASLLPGQAFQSTVTVCNQGTAGDYAEVNLFFVSGPDDAATDPSGGFYVGYLEAGQCITQDYLVYGTTREGTSYLRAFVDHQGLRYELNESNNARHTGVVHVGY